MADPLFTLAQSVLEQVVIDTVTDPQTGVTIEHISAMTSFMANIRRVFRSGYAPLPKELTFIGAEVTANALQPLLNSQTRRFSGGGGLPNYNPLFHGSRVIATRNIGNGVPGIIVRPTTPNLRGLARNIWIRDVIPTVVRLINDPHTINLIQVTICFALERVWNFIIARNSSLVAGAIRSSGGTP